MYQQHFGMHTDPFPLSPKLAFVFPSRAFGETMAHLVYGIEQAEDIILITGGIGTGKTLAVNNLLTQIHRVLEPVVINVTRLTFAELIKTVLLELGETVPAGADTADLLQQMKRVLHTRRREGRKVLLVVDEAQHLGVETLESLRLLTNLSTPEEQCLQLVLVGQHALEEAIGRRELAQLSQRIRVRYRIEPLSRQEVEAYLDHRVRIAGCPRHLFRPGAIDRIYELSQGTPRVVNILASRALLAAFVAGKNMIEPSHVRAEDLPPVTDAPEASPGAGTTSAAGGLARSPATGDASSQPAAHRHVVPMATAARRGQGTPRREASPPPPVPSEATAGDDEAPYLVLPPPTPDQKARSRGWLYTALIIGLLAIAAAIWQWPHISGSLGPRAGRPGPAATRTGSPPATGAADEGRTPADDPAAQDVVTADPGPAATTAAAETLAAESLAVESPVDVAPDVAPSPARVAPNPPPRRQTPQASPAGGSARRPAVEPTAANVAREVATPPAGRTAAPAVTARPGDVVVHVGSFQDQEHAERMIQRLAAAGFTAYEVRDTADGQPWVRVYTGPFASTEAAEAARERLTSSGTVAYARVVTVGP